MIPNKTISYAIFLLIGQLFSGHFVFAQSEKLKPDGYTLNNLDKDSTLTVPVFQNQQIYNPLFQNGIIFNPLNSFMNKTNSGFSFDEQKPFRNLSFSQNYNDSYLTGIGEYEQFNNYYRFNTNKKTKFSLGFGLVKQSTIFEPFNPNYQFSFRASAEHSITDRLSLYLFGQYVTASINKPKEFFDPFLFKNPLFIQTEMGAGLKAKFNTFKVDFQLINIYGPEFNRMSPVDSKIKFNF